MRKWVAGTLLSLVLAGSAGAEPVPTDCAALASGLRGIQGYALNVPPAGPADGWCVLDGAVLRSNTSDQPDLTAERLRLRGTVDGGVPVSFELDLGGLRIRPKVGDRALDDRLRGVIRLQSADLRLSARVDPARDTLLVDGLTVKLSGGMELALSAEVAGAGLEAGSLAGGELMALDLSLRNDGRLLAPLMALAGEGMAPDLTEAQAVDATRAALRLALDALPEAMFAEEARSALERMVTALPQGRGRLEMSLTAAEGIGAARLMMAGLADDPLGPEALAELFKGARLSASWTPGISP